MSAWSDWRVGALTDDEYRQECEREARKDEYRLDMRAREWEDNDEQMD